MLFYKSGYQIKYNKMLKGVFIINNHGQPRCVKFYENVDEKYQQHLLQEIFMLVSKRSESVCNFTDTSSLPGSWGSRGGTKLVYRHYATLYFIFACEETESELGILDLIQVFVETLDKCFENVCELDLIYHSDNVHYILDEIVQGGLVLETNMHSILTAINDCKKLDQASLNMSLKDSRAKRV
uniref:AP complex subunit sigma n=1 Tax=Aplanochytrium stocchinoi TaxID=215587 RepID=A0A7S3PG58_9STRA|mmetsp:Transcript_5802/g.7626  ORF Transcript_5802/g.7626 Transcript_5802/m.7626 type:complete len:183 (+) Transcript_5802:72-620(+)